MTKSECVENWLDSAAKDLQVCESLFEKKHFDWCLFIGHLVVEKTLKALWIENHHPKPHPRIHNLLKLAKQIPLQLNEEQEDFLLDANTFYLSGRYPEDKKQFYKLCTLEYTQKHFNAIKTFRKWLLNQF